MDRQHNGRKYVKSQYTEVVIKNRKEKTDKQYHGQKKRKDRQTIPWSKEKKRQKDKIHIKLYRKLQIRQHQ